jgi:hypothetical protein
VLPSIQLGEVGEINNKKFCEELIPYFPWYDTGRTENDAFNNYSVVACVFVRAVTLPNNDRGVFAEPLPTQTDGIF